MSASNISSVTSIHVKITFLRMDFFSQSDCLELPTGYFIEKVTGIPISFYKYLYYQVGKSSCWWMRHVVTDADLQALLSDPLVDIYVLKDSENVISGFFELDHRFCLDVNLAYFGLFPHAIGKGLGASFLSQAIQAAWQKNIRCLRVNTSELDHSRALDLYIKAGFEPFKTEFQVWDIPDILNLPIPQRFLKKKRR